jgi:hypothetical protein
VTKRLAGPCHGHSSHCDVVASSSPGQGLSSFILREIRTCRAFNAQSRDLTVTGRALDREISVVSRLVQESSVVACQPNASPGTTCQNVGAVTTLDRLHFTGCETNAGAAYITAADDMVWRFSFSAVAECGSVAAFGERDSEYCISISLYIRSCHFHNNSVAIAVISVFQSAPSLTSRIVSANSGGPLHGVAKQVGRPSTDGWCFLWKLPKSQHYRRDGECYGKHSDGTINFQAFRHTLVPTASRSQTPASASSGSKSSSPNSAVSHSFFTDSTYFSQFCVHLRRFEIAVATCNSAKHASSRRRSPPRSGTVHFPAGTRSPATQSPIESCSLHTTQSPIQSRSRWKTLCQPKTAVTTRSPQSSGA